MENRKIINANNLVDNFNWCKDKGKNIMAMVKADAYGHGYKNVACALKDRCKYFGVANEKEAVSLKRILSNNHIVLVVGKCHSYKRLLKNGIHITVDNLFEIKRIEAICKRINTCANIHIAINTGMNRIGVKNLKEFKQMLSYIHENNYINLKGVFTHLYNADLRVNDVDLQLEKFSKYISLVNKDNILIHVGGSFSLVHKLPSYINMVRCGLFIYGYGNQNLKPAMSIESNITKITYCKHLEKVGYGNFSLRKNSKVALVPLGYADGLPRQISSKGYVVVNNKKCKILGNICMDMFMVDVTKANASVGDRVLVFNNAEYFAKLVNTSPYEILTNFSKARVRYIVKNCNHTK